MDLSKFFEFHVHLTSTTPKLHHRYLYDRIDWSDHSIMLIGPRGVGKTTLLIQQAQGSNKDIDEWLYLSGDYYELNAQGLYNVVNEYFKQKAANLVIIDEIHKYPNWRQEYKNILDAFKSKRILVSGSSMLALLEEHKRGKSSKDLYSRADLARRKTEYQLKHCSFREFLNFKFELSIQTLSLKEITDNAAQHSIAIMKELQKYSTTVLKEFSLYLEFGCYPFFMEGIHHFHQKLYKTMENTIYDDIAFLLDLGNEGAKKLASFYSKIASSKPFSPNISSLARDMGVSRNLVYDYLYYLHKAGLTRNLYPFVSKTSLIGKKPEKICVANPNLILTARDRRIDTELLGAIRESFFVSNFNETEIVTSKHGDFIIDGMTFEVGGRGKTTHQINDIENSYLVKDGIEIGSSKNIPLYLFGFYY